jgi:hypothetical protein
MWSTRRLNDMDPCPWSATPWERTWGVPAQRVTYLPPGSSLAIPEPEVRRRRLQLIVSLGISLPCQVISADLRLARTVTYRR